MKKSRKIGLAIFDMDGTIFTSNIDWKDVKKKLNVNDTSILEKIYNGNKTDKNALKYLEEIEEKNAEECKPFTGSHEFIKKISENGIITTLVTNNSRKNAEYLLNKFGFSFHTLITREEKMWKPSPLAFRYLMNKFHVSPEHTITIGDSDFDVRASVSADISDIYITKNSEIRGEYPIGIKYFNDYTHLSSMIFGSR